MTEESPSAEKQHSNTNGITSLLSSWISAQKSITAASARLLLADSKLAALSAVQILALCILAFFLLNAIWLILCVMLVTGLVQAGLTVITALILLLALHGLLLGIIVWVIRASLTGLRFETSRALLNQVKSEIASVEKQNADNTVDS